MNQEVLDKVLQSPLIPSLPAIALKVIDLVQRSDVEIEEIAETIQHDPALTSKILKTVNSTFYGQSRSISTVSQALVVLGLSSVRTLALGFSLVTDLQKDGDEGFDHVDFWKRSLYTAVAARTLAKQAGSPKAEEAFLGGLLQDLGLLSMHQALGEDYDAVLNAAGEDHRALCKHERDKLDLDHAEVGGELAQSWNLPDVLTSLIRFHEQAPDEHEHLLLIRCVLTGNLVADVFMDLDAGAALKKYHQLTKEWFDLEQAQADPLFEKIHESSEEIRQLFDLPTGPLGNAGAILARANEALQNISLQQQQQVSQLQTQNQELSRKATTDALTGVANRGSLDRHIDEKFSKATAEAPLSLLFLDADHFKKFNDIYGHHTGDTVLKELAGVLRGLFDTMGLVARYGGEEFAVVLPDTDRAMATRLAEQARKQIEETVVTSDDGQQLRITASIGVATHDGAYFKAIRDWVKAADQGVYAAKTAGRNCVRVFAPKSKAAAS